MFYLFGPENSNATIWRDKMTLIELPISYGHATYAKDSQAHKLLLCIKESQAVKSWETLS